MPFSPKELEYFANLEVVPGSSWEEIKAAYKKLILRYHPDRFARDVEGQKIATQVTKRLNEAFEYLEKRQSK
jgi:curved DNA-binding protein CbpA